MASFESQGTEEDIELNDDNYYAFLNISHDACTEDINNAYRRLSRLYHPDKHTDPVRKKEAESLFSKTKRAYEVLSDPHKRAIYDNLGTKGLETEGWEIVQRMKTPQEIREEYEQLARERDERRLQQRTNPKGTFSVGINATDLYNRYDRLTYDDPLSHSSYPNIEISAITFTQSIEAPLTLRDTAIIAGSLSTRNGTGGGSVNVSLRRVISEKGWCELEFGAGNGPVFTVKGFRTLTRRAFTNMSGVFQFTPHGIKPGLIATVANQLDKNTVGYITWKAGFQSAANTMIVRDTKTSHCVLSLQLGIPHSFAMFSVTYKFQEYEAKVKGSIRVGTLGSFIDYGAEKKISEHSTLSANVTLGVPTGVILKIKLSRANQTYLFPIHLCEEVLPSPVFYATVVPLLTWFAMKKLIIDPYLHKQNQEEKEKQKEANKARMAEKRREAEAAVQLMRETYHRIRLEEESKKGLVIVCSLYGRLVAEGGTVVDKAGEEVIDVTVQLQCLVKDSKLVLYEASKSQLPGFYDPCVGEDKSLLIQYRFHSILHEVTAGEREPVRIPKQSHRINPS